MNTKLTLLGLDVGDKRVGVAICRAGVVTPIGAFNRAKGQAETQILKMIKEHGVETLVVGLPLDESGQETQQSEKIRGFCRRIEKRSEASIHYIDEYGSSAEAKQRLAEGGRKQQLARRSGMIDAVSASIILQSFLDTRFSSGRE